MNKTYLKYKKLLTGRRALTKGQIQSLAAALNGLKKVNLTSTERAELTYLLNARTERPITREQSKFGIDWLRKFTFRKNGEARVSKSVPFGYRERAIILDFAKFSWVGYYSQNTSSYTEYRSLVPIYRVHAKNGVYFDYTVTSIGLIKSVEVI